MKTTTTLSLLLGILLAGGCREPGDPGPGGEAHAHGPEGDHDHEETTLQITVWSEGYEIFAEHTPPVVGEPTQFITHVSDLRTGQPRASGPVKFILRQGATQFEHPQARPERPGIYLPAITFPSEGAWEASIVVPGETSATVHLGTVMVFPSADAAAHADHPEAPEGVSFLKEQQWRISARTTQVKRTELVERLALHATVVPAPGGKVTVHAPVAGRLLPGQIATLGAEVKAGDLLGWLEPAFNEHTATLVEAEAEVFRTRGALEQAEAALERVRALHEQQAKSDRELQEAELAYRAAAASHDAASRIQRLYRATGASFEDGSFRVALRAPVDGVLDQVPVRVGERLEREAPLFTILHPGSALVEAKVPESRARQIQPGADALLQLGSGGRAVISSNALAFVGMNREVDPVTRTLRVTYSLDGEGQAVPLGAAVTLLVSTGKSPEASAIPSSAIVEDEGIPVVFVQVSGETFQKRDVIPGVRDGEWTGIESGVAEGERVVTEGAYALLLSTRSGSIPEHGHTH